MTSAARLRIPRQRTDEPLTPARPTDPHELSCSACGRSRLTRIAMTLTDGSPVLFVSCRSCEHREWTQQGRVLELDSVLGKARKPR